MANINVHVKIHVFFQLYVMFLFDKHFILKEINWIRFLRHRTLPVGSEIKTIFWKYAFIFNINDIGDFF